MGGGGGNRMASLYEYRISIAMLAGTVVRTVNGLLIDRLFMLRDYDSTVQFSHLRSLLIFSSYIVIICLPFLFFITSFLFLDFSHAYITPFPSRWRELFGVRKFKGNIVTLFNSLRNISSTTTGVVRVFLALVFSAVLSKLVLFSTNFKNSWVTND